MEKIGDDMMCSECNCPPVHEQESFMESNWCHAAAPLQVPSLCEELTSGEEFTKEGKICGRICLKKKRRRKTLQYSLLLLS